MLRNFSDVCGAVNNESKYASVEVFGDGEKCLRFEEGMSSWRFMGVVISLFKGGF